VKVGEQGAAQNSSVSANAGRMIASRRRVPVAARAASRGFTLIEMLVLIILIAIMSSVAVPRYANFLAKARYRQAVRETLDLFAWARERAVQTQSDVVVRFDPQSETFLVTVDSPNPGADLPTALQSSQEAQTAVATAPRAVTLGENVMVADFRVYSSMANNSASRQSGSRTLELRFRDDGSCDGASFIIVSAEGDRSNIEVLPASGKAVVRDDVL
jgi:prepilin-type N-terminal cleavage/methylation domain-containing protein